MLRREDRERKTAEWLEHLQAWKASGLSLSAYARQKGLQLATAYQWRARLARQGLWSEAPRAPRSEVSARVPLRFARVSVASEPVTGAMIVRVILGNGRRAEIEVGQSDQLYEVLRVLERTT